MNRTEGKDTCLQKEDSIRTECSEKAGYRVWNSGLSILQEKHAGFGLVDTMDRLFTGERRGGMTMRRLPFAELLKEMTKGKSWTLVAYEVEHWNQDFSPWAVPSVFGQEEFTGGAKETTDWLIDQCIPFVEGNLTTDCSARLIGGYSLAGLFSLFTFYESGEFNGVASCSGSLWYPDGKNMRSASMRRNEALCISASDKRKKRRATGKWLLLVR